MYLLEILLDLLRLCWNKTNQMVETMFGIPISSISGLGTAQSLSSELHFLAMASLQPLLSQLAHVEQDKSAHYTMPTE